MIGCVCGNMLYIIVRKIRFLCKITLILDSNDIYFVLFFRFRYKFIGQMHSNNTTSDAAAA